MAAAAGVPNWSPRPRATKEMTYSGLNRVDHLFGAADVPNWRFGPRTEKIPSELEEVVRPERGRGEQPHRDAELDHHAVVRRLEDVAVDRVLRFVERTVLSHRQPFGRAGR